MGESLADDKGHSKDMLAMRPADDMPATAPPPAAPAADGDSSEDDMPSSRMKGRFSKAEKKILFSVIRDDPELLRSFLHQLKRRIWDGKSWMHEIGNRFNKLSERQRSHDAVRHHLKLRRPFNAEPRTPVNQYVQEEQDFVTLLEHTINCTRKDACTRCLQLHRLRVKRGFASCGHPACDLCDPALPHVLEPYDAAALLNRQLTLSKLKSASKRNAAAAGLRIDTGLGSSLGGGGLDLQTGFGLGLGSLLAAPPADRHRALLEMLEFDQAAQKQQQQQQQQRAQLLQLLQPQPQPQPQTNTNSLDDLTRLRLLQSLLSPTSNNTATPTQTSPLSALLAQSGALDACISPITARGDLAGAKRWLDNAADHGDSFAQKKHRTT